MVKIPEWAFPLLGMAGAAASNIVLFKTINAHLSGPHKIFESPGYWALHYNDDTIINQAIGLLITGYGFAKKSTKALGFGLGWTLEEFIGKFVIEGKNCGLFGQAGQFYPVGTLGHYNEKTKWKVR